jgi:hypothetical protein
VVFTGDYSSLIDFGGGALVGPGHVYLAKLDAAGHHVFSKSYNASYARVASTPAGDLALLGSSTLTPPDLGGGPLPLVAVGSRDIFFARLSPAGTFMWAKAIGSSDNDWAGVVAFDGAQNIVFSAVSVTGIDYGGGVLADAHLVKMSPTGQYMWGKAVPGASFTHMETDTGDAIYVSASAIGPVDFGGGPLLPAGNPDVVLVKLDAGGQQLHALRAGNDWGQTPLWISPRGGQGAAVAGFFGGTMDLGAGPMSCNGSSCAFVASFPP